ncbi:hypothetical protein [Planococcus salinarum]|uniref:hypothetical protein n=1 Tax=Planococcus salinarum TaxID=622695 RepID=UPI00115F3B5E|nr:hypothetical protein [Planococcus salinarum]TAA69739.1 hypothetical protein D2909_12370 [Planococcus salinarum]
MKLLYGISGFYNSDEPKPPEVDVRKYEEMCYELAEKLGGEVLEFTDSLYPANFNKAYFRFPGKNVCLVMNKHYPVLAFAKTVEAMKIEFIDFPEGSAEIPGEYTVLTRDVLEADVPDNLTELLGHGLNKGEMEQIRYWKPETVGQVIFNFWN